MRDREQYSPTGSGRCVVRSDAASGRYFRVKGSAANSRESLVRRATRTFSFEFPEHFLRDLTLQTTGNYLSTIDPLRVYVVGVFFLGLSMGTSTVLYAINKHKYDIPIVVGCVAFNVCLDLAFVGWAHWGLMGIALGSASAYVSYWTVHTTLIRHCFGHRIGHALLLNLASVWPAFALAAADVAAWATGNLWGPARWFGILLLAVFVGVSFVLWRGGSQWTLGRRESESPHT